MGDDGAAIDWEGARSSNLANWEDRVPLHEESYGIAAFDDPEHRSPVVRTDLAALAPFVPSIDGLDVCHLQCHIGTDTVSLARAGAWVTGVDFSPGALRSAAALADRLGVEATSHPSLYALDEAADSMQLRYPYFSSDAPQVWDDASTYSGDSTVAHARTYEWAHPLSDIVNALIGAALRILRLEEGRTLPWRFSPRMVEVPDGFAWPEGERELVPCTYTIVARKD